MVAIPDQNVGTQSSKDKTLSSSWEYSKENTRVEKMTCDIATFDGGIDKDKSESSATCAGEATGVGEATSAGKATCVGSVTGAGGVTCDCNVLLSDRAFCAGKAMKIDKSRVFSSNLEKNKV